MANKNTKQANNQNNSAASPSERKYRSIGEMVEAKDFEKFEESIYLLEDAKKTSPKIDHQVTLNQLLNIAVRVDDERFIPKLMALGAEINPSPNIDIKPPLEVAFEYNMNTKMIKLLLSLGADVNYRNDEGRNYISIFCDDNYLDESNPNNQKERKEYMERLCKTFDILIDANINVNQTDISNRSALHILAEKNNETVTRYLISKNIDPTIETFVDGSVASQYVSEDNDNLYNLLEDYRESYIKQNKNKNSFKL